MALKQFITGVCITALATAGYPSKHLPPPVVLVKESKPPNGVEQINLQALLYGKLIVINRCLYIQAYENNETRRLTNTLAIWRWNDSWERDGSKIKIMKKTQKQYATIGEYSRFGGGVFDINNEYIQGCKVFNNRVFHAHSIEQKRPSSKTKEVLKEFMNKVTQ